MENIDKLKHSQATSPKYILSNANVFVSPSGFHYIDYLDIIEDNTLEINEPELSDEAISYIEKSLQSNSKKYENQLNIVKGQLSKKNIKVLDVGCGGGLFLSMLKNEGATVMGIELSHSRAYYAKKKYNIEIIKKPIESKYWQRENANTFDVITLWDVIEHVNYPFSTLISSSNLLKKGGFLFIGTPCRDSFFHQVGEFTYWLSRGRFPTFLNTMYSSKKFGHKQIFSTSEMRALLEQSNIEVIEVKKLHELSFPYSFYLKKIFKSDFIVRILLPFVHFLLFTFPVKNKMLVIGRKK